MLPTWTVGMMKSSNAGTHALSKFVGTSAFQRLTGAAAAMR
nr:hypothetical protein [Kibdelosporangium sp. MJ126-NF4]